jgi:nicotinamide riboside kinase
MGLVIAILGAESTGKTVLAQRLAQRLREETGLVITWVPEVLREWCDDHGRTPRVDEQAAIAHEQARRIDEAAARHDVVLADTTPLATAVYSDLLFGDHSLHDFALQAQRGYALTLLTALDLPWVADRHLRDGEHVRGPVDSALRRALVDAGLGWSLVAGRDDARVDAALNAITPLLPRGGLLTRLRERDAAQPDWRWVCEKCDSPECEHALQRERPAGSPR